MNYYYYHHHHYYYYNYYYYSPKKQNQNEKFTVFQCREKTSSYRLTIVSVIILIILTFANVPKYMLSYYI